MLDLARTLEELATRTPRAFAPPSSRVALDHPLGDRPRVRVREHELREVGRPALGVPQGDVAAEAGAEDDGALDAESLEQAVQVGRPRLDVPACPACCGR